jgi:hypothetical protein
MMKRALTICGLFGALMIGIAAASAQKGANFAGTWELDKSKSLLPQMMADDVKSAMWAVTQDDKQLTREQRIERAEGSGGPGSGGGIGGRTLIVKLDGSETTTESERGKSTSKAKWLNEGKTLEIITISDFSTPNGDRRVVTAKEHWELADDVKTLKVHRKTESKAGPAAPGSLRPGARALEESVWVFTKK